MATKRKASPEATPQQPLLEIDSDDDRLNEISWTPGQIRTRIRTFLDSGEMKIGEFQKAIGVSSRSYLDFMRQSGRDKGLYSATYANAARFFKKRELQGLKPPRKKRAPAGEKPEPARFDVSDIHLPGEEDMSVPVYDTCDVVRKKIAAHLAQPGMTQAQFLRDAAAAAMPLEQKLASKTLADFRSKHGANAGSTSSIFYAAYVFFEKLRIKDGKPKSKFREEMEEVWSAGGMDRDVDGRTKYICSRGKTPFVNKWGRVEVC